MFVLFLKYQICSRYTNNADKTDLKNSYEGDSKKYQPDPNLLLIVIVPIAPAKFKRRDIIRSTYVPEYFYYLNKSL